MLTVNSDGRNSLTYPRNYYYTGISINDTMVLLQVHHKTLKVLAEIASSPAAPMEPSSLDITCPSQRNIYFRSLLRRLLESFSAFPELTDIDRCHGLFIIR